MQQWFEDLVEQLFWQALKDFFNWVAETAEEEAEAHLATLSVGDKLASSPLVKVLAVTDTTITLLIRGRVKLYPGAASAFMRIELTVSKDLDFTSGSKPITIEDWHTVIGDLDITKKDVFKANLAFGYDRGTWLGRGALTVVPAGFGLDIFLGGLNDRGLMVGLSVDLPAAIPLGPTGVGLKGLGGDFAYNFVPRLAPTGTAPITDPTATHYVAWARNDDVDRWQPGPIDETAVGIGIESDLVTIYDNGLTMKLEPIGLAVLTPGPVFVLGGVGKLLNTNSARIEGYTAIDIASASLALGLGVRIKLPDKGANTLLDARGTLDALFSFRDPSIWYVNFGTQKKPVTGKMINDLWGAELFLMLDNDRAHLGAGLSIGKKWDWWKFEAWARIGARAEALLGLNPRQFCGLIVIWGELGVKLWKFKLKLNVDAKARGSTPNPTKLDLEVSFKFNLPWPVPDVKGTAKLSYSDANPLPPELDRPLLSGDPTAKDAIAGVHGISGRQWDLDNDPIWPDTDLVVPFTVRTTDNTGEVVGPPVGTYVQGGYDVDHTLTALELHDLVAGTQVPGVTATWVAGPTGDTARLHVLGSDPFSWLTPHTDTIYSAYQTPAPYTLQRFGAGEPDSFTNDRRFGEMVVAPDGRADLVTDFEPTLTTRVMFSHRFDLRWETAKGVSLQVDSVELYLIGRDIKDSGRLGQTQLEVETSEGNTTAILVRPLEGSLGLYRAVVPLSGSVSQLNVRARGDFHLLVYGVGYVQDRNLFVNATDKIVLKPGHYRLDVAGTSTGTHPSGSAALPPSTPVDWQDSQEFHVDYPEKLRSYISEATIGDSRLFGATPEWNPTMYGVGFPHYQSYLPAVRFRVPYMSEIFDTLTLTLAYDDGVADSHAITPAAVASGTSSLAGPARNWLAAAGLAVHADEELLAPSAPTQNGPAAVRLSFTHPTTSADTKLDEWTGYVSTFADFAAHLAWVGPCITTLYSSAGLQSVACCPPIPDSPPSSTGLVVEIVQAFVRAVHRLAEYLVPAFRGRWTVALPPLEPPSSTPFPDELSAPPHTWRLSPDQVDQLGPLDDIAGTRYSRFALESGVRFQAGAGDVLTGLGDTVDATTIEALIDDKQRPMALWVRTPEPVDWRRVSAALDIKHVAPADGCPTGYAERLPLQLEIDILPSPDATAAFLVGELDGVHTHLPRGEYELTISFDPSFPGLPDLVPPPTIAGSPETVSYTFIQPYGRDWPQPKDGILVPADVLEYIHTQRLLDPDVIWELTQPPHAPPRIPDSPLPDEEPDP